MSRIDRHSILERYIFQRSRWNSFTRYQDPNEIQRISRRDRYDLSRRWIFTGSPQRVDRYGKCELLSDESADEAPAANFAQVFQPAIRDQKLSPARNHAFSRKNFAKNHAVTSEQCPAHGFERSFSLGNFTHMQDGPAAYTVPGTRGVHLPLSRSTLGINHGADIVKAIRRDNPRCYQLPQRAFRLRFNDPGAPRDVSEK